MLTRYDPFQDLFRIQDNLLGRAAAKSAADNGFIPAVDIYEDEEGLAFEAELPGLRASDVEIELEKDVLTVRGERKLEHRPGDPGAWRVERRHGRFERAFRLPDAVDPESVKADMADGVLTVRFAKKPEVRPRKIEVKTSGSRETLQAA